MALLTGMMTCDKSFTFDSKHLIISSLSQNTLWQFFNPLITAGYHRN